MASGRTSRRLWAASSAAAVALLGGALAASDVRSPLAGARRFFLPGPTSAGHHQIEAACAECHASAFDGAEVLQAACVRCHGAELAAAEDSHPKSKFTDPRNADRVAQLDARLCVTCHREHRPEVTSAMGLSLPADYCVHCHAEVAEERPTHRGLAFDSCASAGCHNFHDNRALYESFLVEHAGEPALRDAPALPARGLAPWLRERGDARPALSTVQADGPANADPRRVMEWADTSHARGGVNCRDCHAPGGATWSDRPGAGACGECHASERDGFLASRHGMRLAAGLPALEPALARLPMRVDASGALGCTSCHGAHAFDTRRAAADACLGCHADEHSRAWGGSAHARLWRSEAPGGASCATCHLPRVSAGGRVLVHHNQNDFLRPSEKQLRDVCMRCHGLPFALDALADPALVRRNFTGLPARRVESVRFATQLRRELEPKENRP